MPNHNQRAQWKRQQQRELERRYEQALQHARDLKPSAQPTLTSNREPDE